MPKDPRGHCQHWKVAPGEGKAVARNQSPDTAGSHGSSGSSDHAGEVFLVFTTLALGLAAAAETLEDEDWEGRRTGSTGRIPPYPPESSLG